MFFRFTAVEMIIDDDPKGLPKRIEYVMGTLLRFQGAGCAACGEVLCGHHILLSMAAGYQDNPRCARCLGEAINAAELIAYILSKECFSIGWRWANAREGIEGGTPPCVAGLRSPSSPGTHEPVVPGSSPLSADTEWDAGDMACGELLLDLRLRLESMQAGKILKLIARDPGAPEDVPAWCRLTGHALVHFEHPVYFIRRKE